MLLGIGIGIFYMVSLIVAFMAGYGWDKPQNSDEEE